MSNARGRRRGLTRRAVVIMILVFGIPGAAVATWGASKLDSVLPDGEGIDAQAWLRTQDVAPGDTVAIRISAKGGYKATITSATARFGSSRAAVAGSRPDWGGSISARSSGEDDQALALDIPADTPEGESTIELKVGMMMAVPAGDRSFVNRESHDTIQLPITVRSSGARTARRWLHRGVALLAWLIAFSLAYWLVRLIPRAGARDPDQQNASDAFVQILILAIFAGIFVVGVAGQVVFVRPLLATFASDSWFVTTGLMIVWVLSLVAGGLTGMHRRTQLLRWSPLRLRAVMGSTVPTLPAELSRDAERHSDAELIAAIESAGFKLSRGKTFDVSKDGAPVMRMRPRKPSPWLPEELMIEIHDDAMPLEVLRKLSELYGPLAYKTLSGASAILT